MQDARRNASAHCLRNRSARPGCARRLLRRVALATPILSALALLLIPAIAFARAGGGEGYHGGGGGHGRGGGGGGGGGGGDGFWIVYYLIRLLFTHPLIGIPVLIIAILLYIKFQNQSGVDLSGGGGGGFTPMNRPSAPLRGPQLEAALASIRTNDTAFDPYAFFERVRPAFVKIQLAWWRQDLTEVRAFISDGVHERFLLQLAEQRDAGWRDHLDNIRVNAIDIAQIESDGVYDVVFLRIAASAVDFRESISTGQRLSGSNAPENFVEIWSFVRRRGARTRSGTTGLMEGNCPNCGAPIEMNQSANCTHCKALLRSGEYDWVLAEITQEVEWNRNVHTNLPGMDALRQRDPDFNAVELEDLASVIFWRKATADRQGKIDPLRKMALPTFSDQYARALAPQPNGRWFMGECAVGSVQLKGLLLGSPMDRAVVEIRWNGKQYISMPGAPARVAGNEVLFHSLFTLSRKAGSMTDVGKGISSAHCPTCGAPDPGGATNACEYCGTVLNDGAHGWVLSDVSNRADADGQRILQELQIQPYPQ